MLMYLACTTVCSLKKISVRLCAVLAFCRLIASQLSLPSHVFLSAACFAISELPLSRIVRTEGFDIADPIMHEISLSSINARKNVQSSPAEIQI